MTSQLSWSWEAVRRRAAHLEILAEEAEQEDKPPVVAEVLRFAAVVLEQLGTAGFEVRAKDALVINVRAAHAEKRADHLADVLREALARYDEGACDVR